jgi:hypothetical protein
MTSRDRWLFLAGLFATTASALLLEVLDTRLLSVLTWYHLSFFAVSIAMFGLSAGGLSVYLRKTPPADLEGCRRLLAENSLAYAISIPLSHFLLLQIPFKMDLVSFQTWTVAWVGLAASGLLAAPFYFAGVAVGLALTRIPSRIGVTYCVDLLGAGLGCLLAIPLLKASDITTATFAASALAALGAICFGAFSATAVLRTFVLVFCGLLMVIAWNLWGPLPLRVLYAKGIPVKRDHIVHEAWNGHSQILVYEPKDGDAFFWGPGLGARDLRASTMRLVIDGSADTHLTKWDGRQPSLDWVRHDVTSLPYHLRRGGDAAVIGAGGGRDILTALWGESRHVTGIEINDILINVVSRRAAGFSHLGADERLRFVHDDARSFLTRTAGRYDVLQMSLIDSWASTSAGAFTLSENGLYTEQAWTAFLQTLKPGGVFSVSRWFSPQRISETTRLLALATAVLLDRGVADRHQHVALVARLSVATLLISPAPLSSADISRIDGLAREEGFDVLVAPGRPPANPLFERILASRNRDELRSATASDVFDYSPPSDERPYFFNLIKPAALWRVQLEDSPGVVEGNLLATMTLILLVGVSTILVGVVILLPLFITRSSFRQPRRHPAFAQAVAYFALIGAGFMLIQIPYLQRFSVYLGHPTYALVVILFAMILSAGLGSLLSERLSIDRRSTLVALPALIAVVLFVVTRTLQPAIDATIHHGLFARALVVVAFTTPASLLLGCCFPVGMRLAGRLDGNMTPWLWGVNGAAGVLASSVAVAISMWSGIHTSLHLAILCYAALIPLVLVMRRAAPQP